MPDSSMDYSSPSRLTRLTPAQIELAAEIGSDPVAICTAVQGLVIEPDDATRAGVSPDRLQERNIRPAEALIDVLTRLDPGDLRSPRAADLRVVGTCRHYAVLGCALLRASGVPARARCGFATYFIAGKSVDHWVVEYWHDSEGRWIRVDTELLGTGRIADPTDLAEGQFLTGGEAWDLYRADIVHPDDFGVAGVDYAWGIGEIRGNAIRDLAALTKVEMLPWDEWGRMDDSYHGRTGPDYDLLIDRISAACASGDPALVRRVYASADLTVPEEMIC